MKENWIREYISQIDFKNDDWSIEKIKEDLRGFLGEYPGIDIKYEKDVMLNEVTGKAKEYMNIEGIAILFTDTDDKIKKIQLKTNIRL